MSTFMKIFTVATSALLVGVSLVVAPVGAPLTASAETIVSQLGNDIDGEGIGDNSGYSVSLSGDGTRVAIGSPWNEDVGSQAGQVRLYDWNGTAWIQLGVDIEGEAAGDASGYSVSLSSDGTTVAIGAKYNDQSATDAGHVRLYRWDGTAWIQLGADIDGEATTNAFFGWSVSLSSDGETVAIGAPSNGSGQVELYHYNGTAWVQLGSDINGDAVVDHFGLSVSLSSDGTRVAIGAPYNDQSATDAGQVRLYDYIGTAWVQVGSDIDGEAADDLFGWSVSLSSDGSRVAIGATGNTGFQLGTDAGQVELYDYNGTAWVQVGSDIDDEAVGDHSGYSVSLSGDGTRVAIGSPFNGDAGSQAGQVRLYDWDGTAWTQVGADINGEAAGDTSGRSVSLSSDGTTVAIGARDNDGSFADAGHVRVHSIVFQAPAAPAAPAPYAGPLLTEFSSRTLDVCAPESITVTGIRLSGATASVQGKNLTVLLNTDTKLVLEFPSGLTPGNNVDLVINSSSGTLTYQDAFDIPAEVCAAEVSKGRWTKLQADGTAVKMYAKDPVGDGKIQFFVDGREIAWVNAVDESDPKLVAAASGYPYLVRSVELKPGKNRFEIKLDGVRVWRATYVPKG